MLTGVEIVGIVLGAVPLAVEALKAVDKSEDKARTIFQTKYHDEVKLDLVRKLSRELTLLTRLLVSLIEHLPGLSESARDNVFDQINRGDWTIDPGITQHLKAYMGSDFPLFQSSLADICVPVHNLFKGSVVTSVSTSPGAHDLNQRIRQFQEASNAWQTQSKVRQRIGLVRKQRKLEHEVDKIVHERKFLDAIIKQPATGTSAALSMAVPSSNFRSRPPASLPRLSSAPYKLLSEKWICTSNCPSNPNVLICMKLPENLHTSSDINETEYHFPLSTTHGSTVTTTDWQEGAVTLRPLVSRHRTAQIAREQSQAIDNICELVRSFQRSSVLNLLFEHYEADGSTSISRIRDEPTPLFEDIDLSDPAVPLAQVLPDLQSLSGLLEVRTLALNLAYGVMTIGGTEWAMNSWTDKSILLYRTAMHTLCLKQPFLSCQMGLKQDPNPGSSPNLGIFHPLPAVLSLGILLLEIETGKSIEDLRKPVDMAGLNKIDKNTDFRAAQRVAKELQVPLSTNDFREAVRACVNPSWGVKGSEVRLDDKSVRTQLYDKVVTRLEQEIEWLKSRQMPAPPGNSGVYKYGYAIRAL